MSSIFLISDTHFGHVGVTKFMRQDGGKLRPWDNIEEMDEALVDNWNKTVSPKDKIYHLGDVVINRRALSTLARLNGDKVLIKGNHDCLDAETECLTKSGWKRGCDVETTDMVLSLNTLGVGEWMPVTSVVKRQHTGKMHSLETQRMSMLVTPNHRVAYYDNPTGVLRYKNADQIKTGLLRLPTCVTSMSDDYPIKDEMLQLLAWVLTDGSITYREEAAYSIQIYQSKVDGISKIKKLLKSCNKDYTIASTGSFAAGTLVCGKPLINDSLEGFVFRLGVESGKDLLKLINGTTTKIPDWMSDLSDRQARLFLESVIDGDGSWASNKLKQAAVVHGREDFLKSLQCLCVQKGINANITVARTKDFRLNINFTSNSKVFSISQSTRNGKWKEVEYSGFVWCITTPHTNFMVRRRGMTFITGNCFKLNEYTPYFRDIRGSYKLDNFILTHIPIHTASIARWSEGNLHGHLHSDSVTLPNGEIDNRYLCLSVEQIDYKPIALEDVKKIMKDRIL